MAMTTESQDPLEETMQGLVRSGTVYFQNNSSGPIFFPRGYVGIGGYIAGMAGSSISRIERGLSPQVPIEEIIRNQELIMALSLNIRHALSTGFIAVKKTRIYIETGEGFQHPDHIQQLLTTYSGAISVSPKVYGGDLTQDLLPQNKIVVVGDQFIKGVIPTPTSGGGYNLNHRSYYTGPRLDGRNIRLGLDVDRVWDAIESPMSAPLDHDGGEICFSRRAVFEQTLMDMYQELV